MRRLPQAFSAPSKQMLSSKPESGLSLTAYTNASPTISTRSSEPSASKPREEALKREQNSCYDHDNGLTPVNPPHRRTTVLVCLDFRRLTCRFTVPEGFVNRQVSGLETIPEKPCISSNAPARNCGPSPCRDQDAAPGSRPRVPLGCVPSACACTRACKPVADQPLLTSQSTGSGVNA